MGHTLLINKPKNWTSHDVVGFLRGVLKTKKIGHAGTLDPFATGLLIVGVGRDATKQLDKFKNLPKKYIAKIKLGAVTDTYDSAGVIKSYVPDTVIPAQAGIQPQGIASKKQYPRFHKDDKVDKRKPSNEEIKKVLNKFVGEIEQIPPMYSAKKVKGKKLYELARKGIEIARKPNMVEIYNITLLEYSYPQLKIEVECSTGTYIRTLAHDIGQVLGTGAYCDELKRTKIGGYSISNAISPKEITKENFIEM